MNGKNHCTNLDEILTRRRAFGCVARLIPESLQLKAQVI